MSKKWYYSKMLWTNAGAVIASFGIYFETGELSAVFPALIAFINFVLRLTTKSAVEL